MSDETSAEPLQVLCNVPLKVIANKVIMVKSGQKFIDSTKDGGQSFSRMIPSNSGLSWTKDGEGTR